MEFLSTNARGSITQTSVVTLRLIHVLSFLIHLSKLVSLEKVRQVLADFLNRKLDVDKEPVLPENLRLQTGASTLLESLAFAIGDEGDVFGKRLLRQV